MPIYEYQCSHCRYYLEVIQKISDAKLKKCPSCGRNTLQKLMSAPVFRLKGSGWYETDFKSDQEQKRNLAGAEKEPPADTKETKEAAPKDAAAKEAAPKDAKEAKDPKPAAAESKGEPAAARKSADKGRAAKSAKRPAAAAKRPAKPARRAAPAKKSPGRRGRR